MIRPPVGLILLWIAATGPARAEDPVAEARKTSSPPAIDGVVNASEWSDATPFKDMFDWESGQRDSLGAEFWLMYDNEAIYFAAKLIDPDPSSIRATEYKTNVGLGSDDNVTFRIDPTGVKEEINEFSVNASTGSSLRIAGGRALKREWVGEFQSKGRVTETGWEVEARVPWKLMQLPAPGPRKARINFLRYNTKTQRGSIHHYTSGSGYSFVGWDKVEIPKMPFERVIKLLPYGFFGADEGGDTLAEGGLDFKTSLTPQIEAVGTVHPDFRNVEGDILSLDFSYTERLAGDRRPFFQEGAGFWSSFLFTSQRIGKFDTGANVYGRINDRLGFGALAIFNFDDETAFAGKTRFDINSEQGFDIATSVLESRNRPDSTAIGGSYWRRFGPYRASLGLGYTDDEEIGSGGFLSFDFDYSKGGLGVDYEYADVDREYFARLGRLRERDFRGSNLNFEYSKPVAAGPIMEWGISSENSYFERHNGDFYTGQHGLFGSLTGRDGTDFDFGYSLSGFEEFRNDRVFYLSLEKPRGDAYRRWQADYVFGKIADENYRQLSLTFLYRPLKNLQLALRHQTQNHFENENLSIFSANYDLGRDQSVSSRLVSRDGDVSGYMSWRKSGNRGTEYYVIVGDPNSQKFRGSLLVKVVVPIEWRP